MIDQIQEFFEGTIGTSLLGLLVALLVLIVGYIIARIVASVIRRLLKRTELDNRLANALTEPDERREFNVEDAIAKIVFWVLMLFVLAAFFQRLGLAGIASPLTGFLENLTAVYLPRLFAAAMLLIIAWLLAMALRLLVKKGADLLKLDDRISKYGALEEGEQVSISESVATAIFWFVFLLFLPPVLIALGIDSIAAPILDVFNSIIGYIPDLLAAGVIFLIGWFIARIVRQIVTNLLKAIGTDSFGERIGLKLQRGLSDLLGTILYIIILLVTVIAALEQLNITALSEPTTQLLTTIVNAIPNLIGAALIVIIAYAIARLLMTLVTELLQGIGFDSLPERLSLRWSDTRTPSQWLGYLLFIVIMIYAASAAVELLGSVFLVETLDAFTAFFWRVILAVIIFGIGLYLARLAYDTIVSTGTNHAVFLGRVAQIAIIFFATAFALREIGVANEIINLAFGITLGALGVAVALALGLGFGLGSKEIAGREVDQFLSSLRAESAAADSNPVESSEE
ncbi:MAG TPA: mechanosensitive ion channel [Anaerolineae bacterium]|jgi:hypothetical protein|nr:mechanosensitive ion channel [Anaerolineae bacterium]